MPHTRDLYIFHVNFPSPRTRTLPHNYITPPSLTISPLTLTVPFLQPFRHLLKLLCRLLNLLLMLLDSLHLRRKLFIFEKALPQSKMLAVVVT